MDWPHLTLRARLTPSSLALVSGSGETRNALSHYTVQTVAALPYARWNPLSARHSVKTTTVSCTRSCSPGPQPKTAGFTTANSLLALTNCKPRRTAVEFSLVFWLIPTRRNSTTSSRSPSLQVSLLPSAFSLLLSVSCGAARQSSFHWFSRSYSPGETPQQVLAAQVCSPPLRPVAFSL